MRGKITVYCGRGKIFSFLGGDGWKGDYYGFQKKTTESFLEGLGRVLFIGSLFPLFMKYFFRFCTLIFPLFFPFLHIFHYCNFNFPLSLSYFVLFLSHYHLFSPTLSFSTVGIGRYSPGGGSIFGHIDIPLFNSSCNWASKYSEA
jgi:hypothetical protein